MMNNTIQCKSELIETFGYPVPTFITTCECGNGNKWYTTGVAILTIKCCKCSKTIRINERKN